MASFIQQIKWLFMNRKLRRIDQRLAANSRARTGIKEWSLELTKQREELLNKIKQHEKDYPL